MKKISNFFTVASGVFATIPGIAVLTSNIGVPPNISKTLFASTIEALGVLTLLLIWINKSKIYSLSIIAITKIAITGIITFIISLFIYLFLFNYFIVQVGQSEGLLFPFWAQGELQKAIERFGSRENLISEWGRDEVFAMINESSKASLLLTTLILLFVYQLIFVSLTFSFGIIGVKTSESTS